MELSVIEERGLRLVEGDPDASVMLRVEDANRVLETCFSVKASRVLLYPRNLTRAFFDLSSGEAGAILQKLRNYGVRLALVCPAGSVELSSRFPEMAAEERLGRSFGVFPTRDAALAWLGDDPEPQ